MRRYAASIVVVAVAAAALTAAGSPAGAARTPRIPIVPSLTPAATEKLWRQLVAHPRLAHARAQGTCRPLRGVFYAQTDWLRLATLLAAQPSPCAQYYVSVPPLAASKTTLRTGEAAKIRALGPSFHALAEVNYTGWSTWVAQNNETWFDAGVEARRRMAAAGFDVAAGDTWAVNEFSSAVRVGTGNARQNVRDLVRGLFTGDGTVPPVKGVVFIAGVGQPVTDTTLYQTNLQNWLGDSAFWTDMSSYVSDWSQEVYPDVRKVDVPGAPVQQRRDSLNDYLQHELVLARIAPPEIQPGASYVEQAYSPLASAAWSWDTGYGWTAVPVAEMASFVSEQVYALRSYSVTTGEPEDHWGFAWAPKNPGLSAGDFAAQTGAILTRLAAAIRDSAALSNPSDPGIEACNGSCNVDLPGAAFTSVWQSFRTWSQPVLAFTTPPQTIAAGSPSGPISISLLNATGAAQPTLAPTAVTLVSSSPRGQFSLVPTGPFTPTLTLTIPAGGTAAGPFYYEDTKAGSETITAGAAGVTSGTQAETVLAGVPTALTVTSSAKTVAAGQTATLSAAGTDQYGNAVPVTAAWKVDPVGLGTLSAPTGTTVTFTPGPKGGHGTVTATGVGLSATVSITVDPGPLHVASIRYGVGAGKTLLVTADLVDARGRPVPGAYLSLVVRRRGYGFFSGHGTTAGNGRKTFRTRHLPGCYRTIIVRASANGYRWDQQTPVNRFCK